MKKSLEDTREVFKYLIWILIVVFTSLLFYKVFIFIKETITNKNISDIVFNIQNYIESDSEKPFIVNYKGIKHICFSNSINKEKVERMNIEFKFNNTLLDDFKNKEELKALIKNGQAPIIIVLEDGSWKKYYVSNLLISPKPNPLCFKNGDMFIIKEYYGYKTVEKYENNFNYE